MLLSVVWDVVLLITAIVLLVWFSYVLWMMLSDRDWGASARNPELRRLKRPKALWLAALPLLVVIGLLLLAAFNGTTALLTLYRGHP
ncbi:hypothetical protein [Brevundimonas sp.]|uniref:hypothetical protein n=1 Tax=Brevundimonas sp. TaxID=1871086 RepID=UPI002D6CA4C9|nr:hypothetical protein [Brevundimonas sp.]HYC74815.1 hypothetical protein [Brevundimonas sp.]